MENKVGGLFVDMKRDSFPEEIMKNVFHKLFLASYELFGLFWGNARRSRIPVAFMMMMNWTTANIYWQCSLRTLKTWICNNCKKRFKWAYILCFVNENSKRHFLINSENFDLLEIPPIVFQWNSYKRLQRLELMMDNV